MVDVHMPGLNGLELQLELKRRRIELPVIMITGQGDIPLAVKAMQAGAVDFIEKPLEQARLLDSVRTALKITLERRHAGETAADAVKRIALLTPREKEVLRLIALGHPNKAVAHELKISPRTVEVHRARLMDKTQARTVSDLVRWAIAAGLLAT